VTYFDTSPPYATYPAQEQPAQKPDLWKTQFLTDVMTSAGLLMYGRTDKKLAQRIADGSARWRTELYTHPAPTQPALTLDKLIDMAVDANLGRRMRPIMWKAGDVFYTDASYRTDELEVFARAIEAHCRGGATS